MQQCKSDPLPLRGCVILLQSAPLSELADCDWKLTKTKIINLQKRKLSRTTQYLMLFNNSQERWVSLEGKTWQPGSRTTGWNVFLESTIFLATNTLGFLYFLWNSGLMRVVLRWRMLAVPCWAHSYLKQSGKEFFSSNICFLVCQYFCINSFQISKSTSCSVCNSCHASKQVFCHIVLICQ